MAVQPICHLHSLAIQETVCCHVLTICCGASPAEIHYGPLSISPPALLHLRSCGGGGGCVLTPSPSLSLSTLWPDGPHKLMANSRDFNSPFIIYSPERRKSPPCEVGGRPGVGGGGQGRDGEALIGSHLMVLALWVSSA